MSKPSYHVIWRKSSTETTHTCTNVGSDVYVMSYIFCAACVVINRCTRPMSEYWHVHPHLLQWCAVSWRWRMVALIRSDRLHLEDLSPSSLPNSCHEWHKAHIHSKFQYWPWCLERIFHRILTGCPKRINRLDKKTSKQVDTEGREKKWGCRATRLPVQDWHEITTKSCHLSSIWPARNIACPVCYLFCTNHWNLKISDHRNLHLANCSFTCSVFQQSPYALPIGPGSYDTNCCQWNPLIGVSADKKFARNRHAIRPSPCFAAPGREKSLTLKAHMQESYNENKAPDYMYWHRRGHYESRTRKGCNPADWGSDPRIITNAQDSPDWWVRSTCAEEYWPQLQINRTDAPEKIFILRKITKN